MLKEKQILKTSGIIWQAIENIHDEEKHQASDADACDICLNSYPIRIAVWAEAQSKSNLLADWSKDGFIINFLQHCLTEVAATPTQATPIATAQRTLLESLDQVIGYLQERRSKTTPASGKPKICQCGHYQGMHWNLQGQCQNKKIVNGDKWICDCEEYTPQKSRHSLDLGAAKRD